jgi:quercetin dioxygenase-like cupin family protein
MRIREDSTKSSSEGEMWLTVGDDTQHLQAGETFALTREIEHSERYGAEGEVVWAARRNEG